MAALSSQALYGQKEISLPSGLMVALMQKSAHKTLSITNKNPLQTFQWFLTTDGHFL